MASCCEATAHSSPAWARGFLTPSPEHKRFLVLVGLPGAGKSTIGVTLARRLGIAFVDLDELIVARAGYPIADLFSREGERGFRAREVESTRWLADSHEAPAVVAAGGGWMANAAAVALFRPLSRIIYLRVTVAGALRRMGRQAPARPLLASGDPAGSLGALLAAREPAYLQADSIINVENVEIEEVIDMLVPLAGSIRAL